MVKRLISVDDDFTLPAAVKAADANLPERLGATALNATYVRFEDTDGNPLPARNVVIKVDALTGEIIDIVSEV